MKATINYEPRPSPGYSAHVVGNDANALAGVSPCGYRYMFRYCSDAVSSIAAQMRPNGCVVRMKS